MIPLPARAADIADEILFPAALSVDRSDRVPSSHFEALVSAGLYGLLAPMGADPARPGADPASPRADLAAAGAVTAALAGGCLATTFVWGQHHGPLIAAAASASARHWAPRIADGSVKAGIAVAALRGPAPVRVRPVDGGYRLDGTVDWVTGWGLVDVVQVAALDEADVVHHLLVDLVPAPTLTAGLVDVMVTRASRTATVTFTGHHVPADRLLSTVPLDDWTRSEAAGSVLNGFLSIGVAERCCRLLGPTPLDAEVGRCRDALLAAAAPAAPAAVSGAAVPGAAPGAAADPVSAVAAARSAASALVLRASAALVVHTGSRSVRLDNHAQRLAREAIFLQSFGSRPTIRTALLSRHTTSLPS